VPAGPTELSRRRVLQGLTLGAAALGLSGCQLAVDQFRGHAAAGATPRRGGTLRVAIPDDIVPANFITTSSTGSEFVLGLVYDRLLCYRNDQVVAEPRLATSWTVAPDGRSVDLALRRGVRFHSGREFTSADVAASVKLFATPTYSTQMMSTAQAVTSVDTSQPYRAVLHLAHPLTNVLDLLDAMPIIDRETQERIPNGDAYVGTGPFVLTRWSPNATITLVRNEHYWQPGRPYLDGVEVSIVPDTTSLTSRLQAAQADLVTGISFRDVERLGANPNFRAVRLTGAENQIYVGTNLQAQPLDRLPVRQAIAYAIDRERIMSEVFRGSGYAINLPWPKYSAAYDAKGNSTYGYDPDRARSLLRGLGKLPTIPYTYPTVNPAYGQTAQIVQNNLEQVGLRIELDPIDSPSFTKELIGAKFKGIWSTYHSFAQYTPSTLVTSAYPFNAAHNASHYVSKGYSARSDGAWRAVTASGESAALAADYRGLNDDLLSALFLIEIGVVVPGWLTSAAVGGVGHTKRLEPVFTDTFLAS
jgi:peptide/nickel transport system substrate-binding protein